MNEETASSVLFTGDKKARRDWRGIYAARLVITYLLVLIWVVFGVQILWFGSDSADLEFRQNTVGLSFSYTAVSLILIVGWMTVLGIYGSRGYKVLGTGPDEYKLIANSSMRLFGLSAIVAYLFRIDVARGYILMALPAGIAVLIFSRWMWRQWLVVERLQGRYSSRVILVGSVGSVTRICRELARLPGAGYLVVGACVSAASPGGFLKGKDIPVFGDIENLHIALETMSADTVLVTGSEEISPERMRELSWSLEPGRYHLVVAPKLIDIGGPRIHTRPVAGLPLIHIETPRYEGLTLFTKRAFDLIGAGSLLFVLSPVFAGIALAIKIGMPGPVFFRQERVGINGATFMVLKFRSMVVDAEERLEQLRLIDRAEGNSILFKMKGDPRVTSVGRFLRRFSLDELPQLVNVLTGSMSLVGPRPPLASEVAVYETHVHRRFLVRPGITGLWQIGGRSNLSWEESVRLDLYYVENWSMAGDFLILWRTVKAVATRDGAY